jgi:CheY-like chemotaxis protein
MMGGAITVDSVEYKGSRFCISLPHLSVAPAEKCSTGEKAFNPKEIIFREATVLVADDVANNRLLIKEFLRPWPITIIEAENGEDTVQLARQHLPNAILLDLRMPVMSGSDAMEQIRKDRDTKSIPIIALTASSMKGEREKMLDMGFSGYLTKPIRKATLVRELMHFIPYTKTTEDSPPDRTIPVEPINRERLPLVIEQLENTYMQAWEQARKNQIFDEIGRFAQRIHALGEENGVMPVKKYGEDLSAQVESFDVEKMNTTLEEYPQLVENIKNLYTDEYDKGG